MSRKASYKSPFPLAVSLTPQSAMSMHRSLACSSRSRATSGFLREPIFYSRTFAVGHIGFLPLLTDVVTQALGCSSSPEYLVFQAIPAPPLCQFQTKVQICAGLAEDGQSLIIQGKPMTTQEFSIQTTVVEAIPVSASSGTTGVLFLPRCS